MDLYVNNLLKSNIYTPIYADLLRLTVTLLLCIATKSFSNIIFDIKLFLMSILDSIFCCFVAYEFISILFFKFPIVLPYTEWNCSLIYTTVFHFCHNFSLLLFFFMCSIRHRVLIIPIDSILIHNVCFSFNPSLK